MKRNNLEFEGFLGINKTMKYAEYLIEPTNMLYVMGTAGVNPFSNPSAVNSENIMMQKGTNDKTYYISDRPEKEILKDLQRNVLLGVYGGGAISVVCFAIILNYLGVI